MERVARSVTARAAAPCSDYGYDLSADASQSDASDWHEIVRIRDAARKNNRPVRGRTPALISIFSAGNR